MMRDTARRYVDNVVIPFIEGDRTREWKMDPLDRLAPTFWNRLTQQVFVRSASQIGLAASRSTQRRNRRHLPSLPPNWLAGTRTG